ncbi:MAG: phosphate ABC transporter substrate-binding protein, partial [Candidatus Bipolaricaulota bacterium]|nr:phosphate ABC transporter substrate-binding protein [Candidatus Bipolaricaulota bacterium]MDW8127271.1 phosphate ABC transporter substrate-binding protein [Candidatus Bipolaricaulota bacterium]
MRRAWFALCVSAVLTLLSSAQPTLPREAVAIVVDGSSTVGPIVQAAAAEFVTLHPQARLAVGISGTSGGFRRFLAQET